MARILVLCTKVPYPPTDGGAIRMFNSARLLAENHNVELLIIGRNRYAEENIDGLRTFAEEVYCFTWPEYRFYLNAVKGLVSGQAFQSLQYSYSKVFDWLADNSSDYDLLYCNTIQTARYALEYPTKSLIDLTDSMARNYASLGEATSGIFKYIYPIESKRLKEYEREAISKVNESIVISPEDKKYITGDNQLENIHVVPNGVDASLLSKEFKAPRGFREGGNTIAYLGSMSYVPNVDAVSFFTDQVLPIIQNHHPDIEFYIVGKSPSRKVQQLSDKEGVVVTGFVDNPYKYIYNTSIFVAPIRYGSGLQNKIIEAMALGKPVVTTSKGLEGIEATPGKHLVVADTADEFAHSINQLLNNPDRRSALGTAAQQLISEKYTWEKIGPKFETIVNQALDKSR